MEEKKKPTSADDKSGDLGQDKSAESKEKEANFEFAGKYLQSVGRRKTAVAQVRLYPEGKGNIAVNNLRINKYFPYSSFSVAVQPLKLAGKINDVDISIVVRGGGGKSQAEAIRHGIARALVLMDKELKGSLKTKGWLTRDSRKKERKKPGLKKARKAPQWSKR